MDEETKLPDWLQIAVDACSILTQPHARNAREAIRAEHAKRLLLQQRVADLEAERDSLRDAVIGTICRQDAPEPGHWLMPAWDFGRELRAERDELRATITAAPEHKA